MSSKTGASEGKLKPDVVCRIDTGFVGENMSFFLLSPQSLAAATSLLCSASAVSGRTTVPMKGSTAVTSTVPAQTTSKQ